MKLDHLPKNVTKEKLLEFIESQGATTGMVAGTQAFRLCGKDTTNKSPHAFVNYIDSTSCESACSLLNDKQMGGVPIKAKMKTNTSTAGSNPRQPRPSDPRPHVAVPSPPSVDSTNAKATSTIKVELRGAPESELLAAGDQLLNYFSQFGPIKDKPIVRTGDPYHAYVNFSSQDAATKACEKSFANMGSIQLKIKVQRAKPSATSKPCSTPVIQNGKNAGGSHNQLPQPATAATRSCTVKVELRGPLAESITGHDLQTCFEHLVGDGIEDEPRIIKGDPYFAYVNFFSPDAAEKASNKKAIKFKGVNITIKPSTKTKPDYDKLDTEAFTSQDAVVDRLLATFHFDEIKKKIESRFNVTIKAESSASTPLIHVTGIKDNVEQALLQLKSEAAVLKDKIVKKSKTFNCHAIPLMFSSPDLFEKIQEKFCVEFFVLKSPCNYDDPEEKALFVCAKLAHYFKPSAEIIVKADVLSDYFTADHHQKGSCYVPRSITVLCRGLEDSVSASLTELQKKVEESYIERDLKFENDLQAVEMPKVANEYLVHVRKLPGKLSLMGERQYVDMVSIDIKREMSTIRKPLSGAESIGPDWEPQIEKIELKNVPSTSNEWHTIENRFKETLPRSQLKGIQRIQNKWLWEKYAFCRNRMRQKNGEGRVNEKRLFHGPSQTPPDSIYRSEHGFDFRFGAHGLWGKGAYFAVNASYSNSYAYTSGNQRQMFVVFVLTGDSCTIPQDRSLDKPPIKNSSTPERYDSVNGETGSSKVYIVYDHDKSYPAYLITYVYWT